MNATAQTQTNKPLRAVVLGCGWGTAHMQGYVESPDAQLVGIWSRSDKPDAHIASERFAAPLFTGDPDAMLAKLKPDIVSIAVPEDIHEAMAAIAFRHGCHVYCEKVLSDSTEAAKRMINVASDANRQLGVAYNYRYSASISWLRQQVLDGAIGQPLFAQLWSFTWCLHHMTDAISSLFGSPREVMATLELDELPGKPHQSIRKPGHLFETFAYAAYTRKCYTVRYDGGALLQSGATDYSYAEQPAAQVLIQGSEGRLLLDDLSGQVQLWRTGREAVVFSPSQIRDRLDLVSLGAMGAADFSRAIAAGESAPIPAADGLAMIGLEEAIFKAANTGQWEKVNL